MKNLKYKILRGWYKFRHGITISLNGSMLPKLGKGRYADVTRKGEIIEIKYHGSNRMVRLIPYQPNHGVMVETWEGGKLIGRQCDSFRELFKDGFA